MVGGLSCFWEHLTPCVDGLVAIRRALEVVFEFIADFAVVVLCACCDECDGGWNCAILEVGFLELRHQIIDLCIDADCRCWTDALIEVVWIAAEAERHDFVFVEANGFAVGILDLPIVDACACADFGIAW